MTPKQPTCFTVKETELIKRDCLQKMHQFNRLSVSVSVFLLISLTSWKKRLTLIILKIGWWRRLLSVHNYLLCNIVCFTRPKQTFQCVYRRNISYLYWTSLKSKLKCMTPFQLLFCRSFHQEGRMSESIKKKLKREGWEFYVDFFNCNCNIILLCMT